MAKRCTVIIVDDNDMMRGILRGMLRGEEYEVIGEARNGVAAVDIANRLKPDIICLDVMMPEKSGLDALCEIKAARPETEVVMITSSSEPETVQGAIQNGASGYIVKPFNAAKVLDTLAHINAKKHQKSAN